MHEPPAAPDLGPRAAADEPGALILRDYLTADRTALANERTLLVYARTALALAITRGSVLRLPTGPPSTTGGVLLLLAGATTFVVGAERYRRARARLAALRLPPGYPR
ncbi:MAG: DUF202 domain-containing protein [Chloroflexi bacterium]|nr:DUF202 domain-containing protein [Chloroflexota bacterium]